VAHLLLHSFPTRRSSDLAVHVTLPHRIGQSSEKQAVSAARACAGVYYAANDAPRAMQETAVQADLLRDIIGNPFRPVSVSLAWRSEEHTSELQSLRHLVC